MHNELIPIHVAPLIFMRTYYILKEALPLGQFATEPLDEKSVWDNIY